VAKLLDYLGMSVGISVALALVAATTFILIGTTPSQDRREAEFYQEGYNAALRGHPAEVCPRVERYQSRYANSWLKGWCDGSESTHKQKKD
jgi:ribosome modulation factor